MLAKSIFAHGEPDPSRGTLDRAGDEVEVQVALSLDQRTSLK